MAATVQGDDDIIDDDVGTNIKYPASVEKAIKEVEFYITVACLAVLISFNKWYLSANTSTGPA